MSTQVDSKMVAVRSLEIMSTGSRADFDAVIHPDATNREARGEPPETRMRGPEGFHATALWLRTAFTDMRHEILHAADGDLVCLDTIMVGRQQGPFVIYTSEGEVDQVFPSSGKMFSVAQTHWVRIPESMVIEHWAARDDLGRAQQLGWLSMTPA
ncbi:ester cyclase [Nocardia sp. NPDC046763]|uniref:ester cyclase n=1 Tax=Nocardia sp. NPDC046763 TaxID=3155256 RepID=UPI0033D055CB